MGRAYYMMSIADGGSDMKFPFFIADKWLETIVTKMDEF
jgi:hypothetical protein